MRTYLTAAVVLAILALTAASVAAYPTEDDPVYGPAPRRVQVASTNSGDIVQIYALQADFHRAASAKNLDLMISLWADDATFTIGGQTSRGKSQIRAWFANVAGAFRPQNSWVSLTPAQKIRINIQGDRATLYFECYYVDVKTGEVKSQITADTTVVRSNGTWLLKDMKAGPASLAP